jgi:hypothetical protein
MTEVKATFSAPGVQRVQGPESAPAYLLPELRIGFLINRIILCS